MWGATDAQISTATAAAAPGGLPRDRAPAYRGGFPAAGRTCLAARGLGGRRRVLSRLLGRGDLDPRTVTNTLDQRCSGGAIALPGPLRLLCRGAGAAEGTFMTLSAMSASMTAS